MNGRRRRVVLARTTELSLKDARQRAGAELVRIRAGESDLLTRRREARVSPTVNKGLEWFFAEYVPARLEAGRLAPSTVDNYRQQAARYLRPALGRQRILDITRRDIEHMVAPLAMVALVQRNRVLAFTSRLFRLFEDWKLRPQHTNPTRGIERAREEARDRVLTPSEMTALGEALDKLGMPTTSFYRWYDRYRTFGGAGLEDRTRGPGRVWNCIPDDVRDPSVDLAPDEPGRSPREGAVTFTDTQSYFVSEASVDRLLKAHDLITRPAFVVIQAGHAFRDKTTAPRGESYQVSHETIYRSLFVQTRGVLKKELVRHLRSKRTIRGSKQATQKGGTRGQIKDIVSIGERPDSVEDRVVPGHWEGDLLPGSNNSHVATLVERHSRYVMLAKVANKETQTVVSALIKQAKKLPNELYKSLTWDRGKELTDHRRFSLATDVDVYFCDPQSPWQRGSNENTNGLLRQYFPKRTDLSVYSQAHLNKVARQLNERPRKTLDFETPAERFNACVALTD